MAEKKVTTAYLTVKDHKRYLILGLDDQTEVECEIDPKMHKVQNFLRKHELMGKDIFNTSQFVGQIFKE